MKHDITEMKLSVEKLAIENGLSLVLLFGSQARGTIHQNSDFDIAVVGERIYSPGDIAQLSFLFSQVLKIKDISIEIVDLKSAPPLLLKEIAQGAVLLYEKEPHLFAKFKIYALKRYFEAKPLLKIRRLALNKFLKQI